MVSGSSYADEIILVCPGRKLIDTQTSAFVICTTNNLYNRLLIHLNYQYSNNKENSLLLLPRENKFYSLFVKNSNTEVLFLSHRITLQSTTEIVILLKRYN